MIKTVAILAMAIALFSLCSGAIADAEKADGFFRSQAWSDSAEAYARLTQDFPENGQYWARLGSSHYQLGNYAMAIKALRTALQNPYENIQQVALRLALARSLAASGKSEEAIASLLEIAASGARPYLQVVSSSEFSELGKNPAYQAVLEQLKPCNSENHRAFDFWLGEWEVNVPGRTGARPQSSITLENDGCSVHEFYRTASGYQGRSINFYDQSTDSWHQTWIDNQGGALYLEGKATENGMVLADDNNRITWTDQTDQRVRQHWESTEDGGKTWSTLFDGFYQKSGF